MPYKFSPSSLSLLKECPRCFWLEFRNGVKRPSGIFPSLPSGMDRVLKTYFDGYRPKLPKPLSSLKGVTLFNDDILSTWRNNFKGIQWKDKDGNVYKGAVDEILQKKDKLIVLDFKTRGFPLKDDTAAFYQDQMDIYNLLLQKNGYLTEDYAYLLFYHPVKVKDDGVEFETDLVKMKIDVKNAERIFKEALKVLKGEMPEASDDCEYCKWCGERGETS